MYNQGRADLGVVVAQSWTKSGPICVLCLFGMGVKDASRVLGRLSNKNRSEEESKISSNLRPHLESIFDALGAETGHLEHGSTVEARPSGGV